MIVNNALETAFAAFGGGVIGLLALYGIATIVFQVRFYRRRRRK